MASVLYTMPNAEDINPCPTEPVYTLPLQTVWI